MGIVGLRPTRIFMDPGTAADRTAPNVEQSSLRSHWDKKQMNPRSHARTTFNENRALEINVMPLTSNVWEL